MNTLISHQYYDVGDLIMGADGKTFKIQTRTTNIQRVKLSRWVILKNRLVCWLGFCKSVERWRPMVLYGYILVEAETE